MLMGKQMQTYQLVNCNIDQNITIFPLTHWNTVSTIFFNLHQQISTNPPLSLQLSIAYLRLDH